MLFKDRVKETTTSTGTGNLTTAGAVTGFITFNTAFGTGSTNKFGYVIDSPGGSEWEVGIGYLSASTTLVRETVLASSTGSAVNFSAGTKYVRNTLPAFDLPLKAVLASNEVRNNTTTMTDTALSVSVAAGKKYRVDLGFYSTGEGADANSYLKVDFGGTATITTFQGLWQVFSDSPVATRTTDATQDRLLTGVFDFTDGYVIFTGTLVVNAAGTFLLRAAQQTAEAADSIIHAGGFLILTPL